jgi:hypothetical protein
MIYVESTLIDLLLPFCFNTVNNDKNRSRITSLINDFYQTITFGQNPGAQSAVAVCNDSNNTSVVIDAEELVVDNFITPALPVEDIKLNFILSKSGVSFTEQTA